MLDAFTHQVDEVGTGGEKSGSRALARDPYGAGNVARLHVLEPTHQIAT
jgi:hypothetical protein